MKCKVVVFPGSNCDYDCFHVMKKVFNIDVEYVWHKESSLGQTDFVILPGGFSYGDYLRCGAIARFSPILQDLAAIAKKGNPIIGICNGFQVLTESHLLPGALLRNNSLRFICKDVYLKTCNTDSIFSNKISKDSVLKMPVAHGDGNYYCDPEVLKELQDGNRIVFRYSDAEGNVSNETNPNGSTENIAGVMNKKGNVLGMMPHPERASEGILASEDGKVIFESIINALS